jgi:transposase
MPKAPIYVRALSEEERTAVTAGLRSTEAFTLRRSQIVLASERRKVASEIGRELGCDTDTALNGIKAFNERGVAALTARPTARQGARSFDEEADEKLWAIVQQSPRNFGKQTSLWTLELLAEVSYEQGLTPEQVSREAVRAAFQRLGVKWKRAKHWITSPDPEYGPKKTRETS